jgi:hypothetical protein
MTDLATIAETLPTITPASLARIEAGMVEQRRIAQIFGRSNSQTSAKLMSLTMLAAGPYRHLRQCAAEIERRQQALRENALRLRRAQLEAQQAREEADSLSGVARDLRLLDAEEKEQQILSARTYVEGALKDVAALQDAYAQIRAAHGIRDAWDEADFEAGEIEHHLRSAFRLAYRDLMHTRRVSSAACEYAEQFGVHPAVLHRRAAEYVAACEAMLSAGQAPSVDHLHDWLDACYQAHKDDVKRAVARLGLTDLITRWSLYVEPDAAE